MKNIWKKPNKFIWRKLSQEYRKYALRSVAQPAGFSVVAWSHLPKDVKIDLRQFGFKNLKDEVKEVI